MKFLVVALAVRAALVSRSSTSDAQTVDYSFVEEDSANIFDRAPDGYDDVLFSGREQRRGRSPDPNRVIVTFKDAPSYMDALFSIEEAAAAPTDEGSDGSSSEDERNAATITVRPRPRWEIGAKVHLKFDESHAFVTSVSPEHVDSLHDDARILAVEQDPVRYMSGSTTTTKHHPRLRPRDPTARSDAKSNNIKSETTGDSNTHSNAISEDHSSLRHRHNISNTETKSNTHRRLQQVVPYGVRMVQANKVPYLGGKTVCVIDTGYGLGHEDLPDANSGLVDGYDSGKANMPWNQDGNGHGTHVAGTIAALDNGRGVVGVAPGVNLFIVRVFGNDGSWAYESDTVHAVQRCVAGGADVVNMSLGGTGSTQFARDAFQRAYRDDGVLLVAAAMNSGKTYYFYPASYPSVISVGAVDRRRRSAKFSQRNDQVELSAPGVSVLSTVPFEIHRASVTVSVENYYPISAKSYLDAAPGDVTGPLVDCDQDTALNNCTNVQGMICVIERSTVWTSKYFNNCQQGGASAVVFHHAKYPCKASSRLGLEGTTNLPTVVCVGKKQARIIRRSAWNGLSGRVAVADTGYRYAEYEGTSMSTPHVSGAAALVWSNHPNCSNREIRETLRATARRNINKKPGSAGSSGTGDIGRTDAFGYGIVRAKRANNRLKRKGGCLRG